MIKKNNKTTSLQFAGLDAIDVPVLADRKPTYTTGSYIRYGDNNQFPDYLSNLYASSAFMNAIVTTITDFMCGQNIQFSPSLILKLNGNKYSELPRIFRKIAFDYVLYGGFALHCYFNRLNEVAKITYEDFRNIRVADDETTLLVAESWAQGRRGQITEYDRFEDFKAGDSNMKNPYECLYYFIGNSRSGIYPMPSYIGSLRSIETNINIDKFHLASCQNGMSASKMVNLIGDYTEDEKMLIERKLHEQFCGVENASQILVTFSDNAENTPTVTMLQDDAFDQKFETLSTTVRQNIFAGFRINPILCGIYPESGGFSRDEYLQAASLFNVTVVRPLQKQIISAFNTVCQVSDGVTIEPFNFDEDEMNTSKDIE